MILSFQDLQSTSMYINLTLQQSYCTQDLAVFQVLEQNLSIRFIQNVIQNTKPKTKTKNFFFVFFTNQKFHHLLSDNSKLNFIIL